ncbi:L-fucose:H+ symporter permease [Fulvivirga sp. M361]|uniref:L-fucose:H+ symporter permease n=1 Tax=Fulvivirga sp. M361 TaxID=2594266 RepID=UPI0011798C8F|nr:L-fucose:H+ symporter permease [Fulvivirga sp. M361]TRX57628.1 L-fucose:H+ symporter permease [Fulvivirga sp. M361]
MEKIISKKNLLPFILITSCFALWGFANDITNPMVAAFEKIFLTGATEATLVQLAFYGGYGVMAFPAALFIRKYSYKSGILLGLGLYALGGLMFLPASSIGEFYPFLIAYFIITCGLSFLETSANPYILSMGSPQTATRRLNLAQAFNPMGSLAGMFVASNFILANLNDKDKASRMELEPAAFASIKSQDLDVVSGPYIIISIVILTVLVLIAMNRMPGNTADDSGQAMDLKSIFGRLAGNRKYVLGVIAQMFYVGAQIMCWTFIIYYGTEVFMARGMGEKDAQVLSQQYNIAAMVVFAISRFVCTFLLSYIRPGRLLMLLALGGILLTFGTIFIGGIYGLYCLVGISACMSLMFPTIYGIALEGISGDDAKIAAAGLIMAIIGGTFLPLLQAGIIDSWTFDFLSGPRASFVLPLLCFVVISFYGYKVYAMNNQISKNGGR